MANILKKVATRYTNNAKQWKQVIPQTIATRKSQLAFNRQQANIAGANYDRKVQEQQNLKDAIDNQNLLKKYGK